MHTEILPGHISAYVYINYLLITEKFQHVFATKVC